MALLTTLGVLLSIPITSLTQPSNTDQTNDQLFELFALPSFEGEWDLSDGEYVLEHAPQDDNDQHEFEAHNKGEGNVIIYFKNADTGLRDTISLGEGETKKFNPVPGSKVKLKDINDGGSPGSEGSITKVSKSTASAAAMAWLRGQAKALYSQTITLTDGEQNSFAGPATDTTYYISSSGSGNSLLIYKDSATGLNRGLSIPAGASGLAVNVDGGSTLTLTDLQDEADGSGPLA